MLEIKNKSVATPATSGNHNFLKLELRPEQFDDLVQRLIELVPDHYVDPNVVSRTLARLGKPQAAEKLRIKIPETKKPGLVILAKSWLQIISRKKLVTQFQLESYAGETIGICQCEVMM